MVWIIPSIGLGWLFPVGKNKGQRSGGPYVGAGVGLGFPFMALNRKTAPKRRPRARRRSPRRDPIERVALGVMSYPIFLAQAMAQSGWKAGKITRNVAVKTGGGFFRAGKTITKSITAAFKSYGNYVSKRSDNFRHQPRSSMLSSDPPRAAFASSPQTSALSMRTPITTAAHQAETPSSGGPSMGGMK